MASDNPYKDLPPSGFWRSGVADPGVFGYKNLWKSKWNLPKDVHFSTYGSCFAQHISRALVARKVAWVNAERGPARTPGDVAKAYNYGTYSARTGNIYTAAQLKLWCELAVGQRDPDALDFYQEGEAAFHDLLRPQIEPHPFFSEAELKASRRTTARAFRTSIAEADVFVFTLGLTEGWVNKKTGQPYPICPGTAVGEFDPELHGFHNYTYPEILSDLQAAFALMRSVNPEIKILLTVSPVPLVATASGNHVLVATMQSKSILRAVAGQLATEREDVDYFPSYEIIAGPPTRAAFFESNMRSVVPQGVELVMTHFFAGVTAKAPAKRAETLADETQADLVEDAALEAAMDADDLVCEEMILEQFNTA